MQSWESLRNIIKLTVLNGEDSLPWTKSLCQFSVKQGYELLEDSNSCPSPWSQIWKLRTPYKVRLFVWKICHKILPTKILLAIRLNSVIKSCSLCHTGEENIDHLFWSCPLSKEVWKKFWIWWSFSPSNRQANDFDLFSVFKTKLNPEWKDA